MTSPNKRVSGLATLRPNPSLSLRASDTRRTLSGISLGGRILKDRKGLSNE